MSDRTEKFFLGIETSCDDTSVAIVSDLGRVIWLERLNQDELHQLYGGVVPEEASREHIRLLMPLVAKCLVETGIEPRTLSGVAVTNRPGLLGSLIVGVMTAQALCMGWGVTLYPVNHLESHLYAPFLTDDSYQPRRKLAYPFLALAVSGGHTHLYMVKNLKQIHILGRSRDDAAGEALDKFAKALGLGFPGGPALEQAAKSGDVRSFQFPRANLGHDNLDFSFSGVKSAGFRMLSSMDPQEINDRAPDLAAAYQEAIMSALLARLQAAQQKTGCKSLVLTGGVSANARLTAMVSEWTQDQKLHLEIPPLRYCTDNAAMVAFCGALHLVAGDEGQSFPLAASASSPNDFEMVAI